MFRRKLWMYNPRPAMGEFAGKRVCWKDGGAGDGSGGDGGSGDGGDGGNGGDGGDGKPTIESLQKLVTDSSAALETYKTETETKVSGLINDLQKEREKNKNKGGDGDGDDGDADKTFLTKKQTEDMIKEAVKTSSTGLATAYSEDKLATSVDKAKIKYTQDKNFIPYAEVIEKGFLQFSKKVPGLLEAMKTAQDPAEFAYTIGIAHPVFAARRRATLSKEIVEEMKKPKPTKITGADGKSEVNAEDAGNLSPEEWSKLPEKTRHALLYGTGNK